jgi:outer membrane protein TolC
MDARGLLRSCTRGLGLALLLLLGGLAVLPAGWAGDDQLPPPRRLADPSARIPGGNPIGVAVTLTDVLRLASVANLDITQARLAVERARAVQVQGRAYALPNLSLGSAYNNHQGTIQKTEGNIITMNRDSLFVGGGPSLSLDLSDALFAAPQANALLQAAAAGQTRVTLDTLLATADAYLAVLRARRRLARIDETFDYLLSDQPTDLRGKSIGLLPLIRAFVKSGTALPSDEARVEADLIRLQDDRLTTLQELRAASAALSRLLHLVPTIMLIPAEEYRVPVPLPGEWWTRQPIEELVSFALRNRPELAENQALIEAALARYRAAHWRPLLPSLSVGYAWGGFGGGPPITGKTASGNTIFGNTSAIYNFDTRGDFDVALYWRLRNMGLGNLSEIRETRARHEQAMVAQMQIQDLVMTQVVQALERVQRGRERIEVIRAGLFDERGQPNGAVYRSIRLNFTRIRGGQGAPLEVLDSVRRLSDVLEAYGNALSDYDQARFRLLVALGLPPGCLLDDERMPVPPGVAVPGKDNGKDNGNKGPPDPDKAKEPSRQARPGEPELHLPRQVPPAESRQPARGPLFRSAGPEDGRQPAPGSGTDATGTGRGSPIPGLPGDGLPPALGPPVLPELAPAGDTRKR